MSENRIRGRRKRSDAEGQGERLLGTFLKQLLLAAADPVPLAS